MKMRRRDGCCRLVVKKSRNREISLFFLITFTCKNNSLFTLKTETWSQTKILGFQFLKKFVLVKWYQTHVFYPNFMNTALTLF